MNDYEIGVQNFKDFPRDYQNFPWDSQAYQGWHDARKEFLKPYEEKVNNLLDSLDSDNFWIDRPAEMKVWINNKPFDLYL